MEPYIIHVHTNIHLHL